MLGAHDLEPANSICYMLTKWLLRLFGARLPVALRNQIRPIIPSILLKFWHFVVFCQAFQSKSECKRQLRAVDFRLWPILFNLISLTTEFKEQASSFAIYISNGNYEMLRDKVTTAHVFFQNIYTSHLHLFPVQIQRIDTEELDFCRWVPSQHALLCTICEWSGGDEDFKRFSNLANDYLCNRQLESSYYKHFSRWNYFACWF